jgi:CheY-like chemotaxis protein
VNAALSDPGIALDLTRRALCRLGVVVGVGQLPVLAGKHILIVEDDFVAAEDMRLAVESAAGGVLGPALSAEQALWWIELHQPDCGILDVGTGPLTTAPVAQRLKELNVPLVVATSFAREFLPPPLHTARYLAKPFVRAELIENVAISIGALAGPSSPARIAAANPKDLRARRDALGIPHAVMATGIRLSPHTILSIEANALVADRDGEKADYYAYWLGRLERLTKEQIDKQLEHARQGRRFS